MGPPCSDRISRAPPYSRLHERLSPTGPSPSMVVLSRNLRVDGREARAWSPVARRYWGSRGCFPFLRLLRYFSSPGSLLTPMDSAQDTTDRGGFPHSDIRGSTAAHASSRLIAVCHVLHRLSTPRHPPDALRSLARSSTQPATPHPTLEPRGERAARPRQEPRAYLQTPPTNAEAGRLTAPDPDGRGRRPRHVENPLHDVQPPARPPLRRRRTETRVFPRRRTRSRGGRRSLSLDQRSRPAAAATAASVGAVVGLGRFERPTSRLSGVRSDQLSYRPRAEPADRAHRRGPAVDESEREGIGRRRPRPPRSRGPRRRPQGSSREGLDPQGSPRGA